jgi:RNase H-fold protein (predicted Holliday junction resolvase)
MAKVSLDNKMRKMRKIINRLKKEFTKPIILFDYNIKTNTAIHDLID